MKTTKTDFQNYRNEEHFFFHTEVKDLITQLNPATLKIQTLFNVYQNLWTKLDEALEKIVKSSITKDIEEQDLQRDNLFRGLCGYNKAMTNHFKSEFVKAAQRIQIVIDKYGNLGKKPMFDETASIYNFLQELTDNYAADIQLIGLKDWVVELGIMNDKFKSLLHNRYDETLQKTTLKAKDVRIEIDTAYKNIVLAVEALALLENAEVHKNFITKMNLIVGKYNSMLAQRKSKNTNNTATATVEPPTVDIPNAEFRPRS